MFDCPLVRSCVFADLSWLETWSLLAETEWRTKMVREKRSWRVDQEGRAGQTSRYKWQSCWAQTPRQWQVQPNILLSFSKSDLSLLGIPAPHSSKTAQTVPVHYKSHATRTFQKTAPRKQKRSLGLLPDCLSKMPGRENRIILSSQFPWTF